jgi:hypothetical protein
MMFLEDLLQSLPLVMWQSTLSFLAVSALQLAQTVMKYVRFEVLTAVTVKNSVFWDVRRVALVRTDVSEELSA